MLDARYGVWNNTLPCLIFTLVILQGLPERLILPKQPRV